MPLAAIAFSQSRGDPATTPSFTRDVAPIVAEKCAGCHQPGGIAPFPLRTARQISSRSTAIAAAVEAGRMPPWPPGPRSPAFAGKEQRALDARQRQTILDWTRAGAPLDGPAWRPVTAAPAAPRAGESVVRLPMPSPYRPRAQGNATDDYRCFLLDPKLSRDALVTSARIVPGRRSIVHHVILFRIDGAQVAEARQLDGGAKGPGWECFGGTGLSLQAGAIRRSLDDAGWVSAWAPGWAGERLPEGTGVLLPAGSQIVMQVHYNLLNGRGPDRSRAHLTLTRLAGTRALETMLLPAPVELACGTDERGPLCDRGAALLDLARRHGSAAALAPVGLLYLCGGDVVRPKPSPISRCDRRVTRAATIRVAAGHMHLLGQSIRITLNPGTSRARILLDIPRWDFHWQNAYALRRPIDVQAGDVLRVTCRFDRAPRTQGGHAPVGGAPRYVLWGEGTTDEMCLGILQVTRR